ncbi:hypothetical protein SPRG_09164 [Saprolegnia parasitica CBS 223.65]|uniref:Ubiquitin-like protease family profile domain-containing protein n=1 Tax=Saprolegnia parasitica (strain CBS 223.65) TaxID=695850 RepID=A0A067C3I4_SAPPC|nr:hypothetical protein SPRG_09164 [Saprolegnia parasitica CBS 223.65]KDO25339.1 hypothetical protein SPRG_09164 [Saprolegnia parasitica CBS 223.65]|eukprot:XP_012203989.1 hypothetical protein SPRG_09164 [Saprolegnia parasitica CBS 223.65]
MARTRIGGDQADKFADLEARVDAQARATATELQEIRAALRVLGRADVEAERDDALRTKTALEHENAELKTKLAALSRDHEELRVNFDKLLHDVQHSTASMVAKYNRGEGDALAVPGRAVAPPVAGKRTSDGPAAASAVAKRPRRHGHGIVAGQGGAASVALTPVSAPSPKAPSRSVACLEAGMDLTTDLVDRFLAKLQDGACAATKPYCRILPASVLSSLMESGALVPSPAAYLDLLSTEIVVLPLLLGGHWSVTMVFRLDAAATETARIAFFDTFDSQHQEHAIHAEVHTFLSNVQHESRPRSRQPLNTSKVNFKVPLQRNPNDSGISMLLYVETALFAYSQVRWARNHGNKSPDVDFDAMRLLFEQTLTVANLRMPVHKRRQEMLEALRDSDKN